MEKIKLITLGCPKNLVDSERMLGRLESSGYCITEDDDADVVIVNTCGFIKPAKEESINTILETAQLKEEGRFRKIVVTGCLAERYKTELQTELPEADLVLGLSDEDRIVEHCDRLLQRNSNNVTAPRRKLLTSPGSAYLKISEGCSKECSFCSIPLIRGKHISEPIEKVVSEANQLVDQGVRELNVISQDTMYYGIDSYGKPMIGQLLKRLSKIERLKWIRLLYTHSAHYTDWIIETIAQNDKLCHYLDIPVQHISDDILTAMNRKTPKKKILEAIGKLRERLPGFVLRTTIIVGFPGETQVHFEELLRFIEWARFERLGVFTYSREEGTPAANLRGHIPESIKMERLDQVMTLQREISAEHSSKMIGHKVEVLVENRSGVEPFDWIGRTQWDAPEVDGVVYLEGKDIKPGNFVWAEITGAGDYDLYGKIIK